MVSRASLLVLVALGAHQAPLQCSRDADDPEARRYETPPEALYDLATRFKTQRDEGAWRRTLEYLVERYPNSRFAVRAGRELAEGTDGGRRVKSDAP